MSASEQPPPDRVFVQSRAGSRYCFQFHSDHLTYAVSNRKLGTKVVRDYPYPALPDGDYFHAHADMAGVYKGAFMLCTLCMVQAAWTRDLVFFGVILVAALALGWIALRVFGDRLGRRSTTIAFGDPPIRILHDRTHDEIVGEIRAHRQRALQAFATLRPSETRRQNLVRLRALARRGAITADEYFAHQRSLLPDVGESFLRMNGRATRDADFVQRRLDVQCRFQFGADHVRFAHADASGRHAFAVSYDNLGPLERLDEGPVASPGLRLATVLGFVAVLSAAYYAYVGMRGLPQYGWAGFSVWGSWCAAWMAALAAVASAFRLGRIRGTHVLRGIFVLKGAKHDAILDELKARRELALRDLAEVDPLMTLDEQRYRLTALAESGVLSEAELEQRMAQAATNQDRLDLDTIVADESDRSPEMVLH
jgi:hypothetical protein